MPIHSPNNEYRGVNAHLHSYFQSQGEWEGFHTSHITDLARSINRLLPLGYAVGLESSLQIREFHPDTGERIRRPKPDVIVYRAGEPPTTRLSDIPAADSATLTLPIIQTFHTLEFLHYSAVMIYQVQEKRGGLGRPVTRLELLSPSNKYGDGFLYYTDKRREALHGGMKLVEIDYLHQTEPVIAGVPSYLRGVPHAWPYLISVSDPTPDYREGLTHVYGFGVDNPIPLIDVPLLGEDRLLLNVDAVYQETFASLRIFSTLVDYAQPPAQFQTYNPADQARIQAVMARVQANQREA